MFACTIRYNKRGIVIRFIFLILLTLHFIRARDPALFLMAPACSDSRKKIPAEVAPSAVLLHWRDPFHVALKNYVVDWETLGIVVLVWDHIYSDMVY